MMTMKLLLVERFYVFFLSFSDIFNKTYFQSKFLDLGLRLKVQILSIDENSLIGGKDKIEPGDLIAKVCI